MSQFAQCKGIIELLMSQREEMEVQEFLNTRCWVQLMEIRWEVPVGLLGPIVTLDHLISFSRCWCSKFLAEVLS